MGFTGEDTNSTALAALALRSVGRTTEADRAIAWLEKARAADGGFPYFVGGASDANSTADVLIALNGAGAPTSSTTPARHFLESLQLGCDGAATDEDGAIEVVCAPADYAVVRDAFTKAGLEPDLAEVTMKPLNDIALAGEDGARMQKLLDALENLDDVQQVYTNALVDEQ